MGVGPYSRLYRQKGGELHVHFFEPNVLDPYRENPDYAFRGNRFSTKENLAKGIEPSGIQQFVWGSKADGDPCVAALRPHLITLSFKDQLHWKSKELSPAESAGAKIDARYARPMLYGLWPDTMSRFAAVYVYLREIQNIFNPEVLLPALPSNSSDFLAPLSYNSTRSFLKFARDVYTILDIKPSVLARRVSSSAKDDLIKRGEKWNLLALYFKERGLLSAAVEAAIGTIKEVNQWRVKGAHTLAPATRDRNYMELQKDIVFRLQQGLRSLLLAFAVIEKGSTDVIDGRVLDLKVE